MLYSQITLLAVISTAACLPQSLDAGFTHDSYRRDELADLYPRYDSEALEVLADRSLWSSLEERGFEDEELLFERSDDDLFDLYARVAVKAPKPPVPPKPDHLKASKTNPSQTTSKSDGSSSGTDWTKKVQDDAKKENKSHWYNKLGVGNKDKGKKNPDNPVPNLEKIAGDQAHKITGYNRKESDATDKKNNKARIKNQKVRIEAVPHFGLGSLCLLRSDLMLTLTFRRRRSTS